MTRNSMRTASILSLRDARTKLLAPVSGGATRQASVHAGLAALDDRGFSHLLVHDAARPFVSPALIDRACAALDIHERRPARYRRHRHDQAYRCFRSCYGNATTFGPCVHDPDTARLFDCVAPSAVARPMPQPAQLPRDGREDLYGFDGALYGMAAVGPLVTRLSQGDPLNVQTHPRGRFQCRPCGGGRETAGFKFVSVQSAN